jgi:signal transduction histidine kinase
MVKESIDRRVIQILRWSIIVQIIFLLLSTFSPRFSIRNNYLEIDSADYLSFASVALMAAILLTISIKKVEDRITKKSLLFILYAIALITIFSRHVFSFSLRRMVPDTAPVLFRWDAIFFLIIPLVFIAWQYSMRHVLIYCLVILVADFGPTLLEQNSNLSSFDPSTLPNDTIPHHDAFSIISDFMGSFARSVILGIVGWIENSLVTLQRKQHNQLAEANQKLQKYALTSERLAQTQERNRLARELHDTLAHTLSSTSVQLEAIKALYDRDPDQAKNLLAQTLVNTKNGLAETRRALVDLRTSELEAYGLTQAIRNLGTSAAERGGFSVEFELDKGLDVLPDDVSHSIYRTVQEAFENILRHSNATQASIKLFTEDNLIHLIIQDNGKGFNLEKVKKDRLGIRGMRERIEMLGGSFEINSEPKKGTEIDIRLEMKYD